MYLYRKAGRRGTDNLHITALINDRIYGLPLGKEELLEIAESYVRQVHNGKVEIIAISTKEE